MYANPFNAPQWLLPWWKYFGEGNPYVLVMRNKTDLVACIPLYIFTSPEGKRQLKLIGTGNSDYMDILVNKEASHEILNSILKFIDQNKNKFDVCEFHGQRDDSFLMNNLHAFSGRISREDISPVSELPGSFKEYVKSLPIQFRKNSQRALKQLTFRGFNLYKADANNIDEFLKVLIELHNSEWNFRNQEGVLYDKKVQSFIYEAVHNFMETGDVRLYALKSENNYAALNIIFRTGNTAFFYIGAYNRDFGKFSPGTVLLWKIIEDCIEDNVKNFDFLKGSEPYKYRWKVKDISVNRIIIYPDT